MSIQIDIFGGEYASLTKHQNAQVCRNLYLVTDYTGGKSALVRFPGLRPYIDTGTGKEIRGMAVMGDYLYVVAGNRFFSISTSGVLTEITTPDSILTDSGIVTFGIDETVSEPQLMICDGTYGYAYNAKTGKLNILTEHNLNYVGGGSCSFMNGRWIYHPPDTHPYSHRFYWSELNNSLDHRLQFLGVQEPSGAIMRLIADKNDIIVFKRNGISFFAPIASNDYQYKKRMGTDISVGLHCRDAVATVNNTVYWLGDDLNAYQLSGYQGVPITPTQLPIQWNRYAKTNDASMIAFTSDGIPFVQINFRQVEKSWVFDAKNKVWTTRSSYQDHYHKDGRHRGNCITWFNNKHIVGDHSNGWLYVMEPSVHTDNGRPIKWKRIFRSIDNQREFLDIAELEITFAPGTAPLNDPGSNPLIAMRYSYDDGNTWSKERMVSMGKTGKYDWRATWNNLGSARVFTIELSGDAPVLTAITGAHIRPPDFWKKQ